MATVESYIIHAHKKIGNSELIGIAQLLKSEKIVKDEAVNTGNMNEPNSHPHIYHFITDGSSEK